MDPIALPATVAAAALSRRHVDAVSPGWRPELREFALLLTSELVTNAVVHGGDPVTLTLRDTPERLRVEVTDAGSYLPGPRPRGRSGTDDMVVACSSSMS